MGLTLLLMFARNNERSTVINALWCKILSARSMGAKRHYETVFEASLGRHNTIYPVSYGIYYITTSQVT